MSNPDIDKNGTKRWFNSEGEPHRLDGPAVVYSSGTHEWWQKGLLHRLDGPAFKTSSGVEEWFYYNKLHRLDGPAVTFANGDKEWWVDDEQVDEEEHPQAVLQYKCKQVLES